MEYGPLKSIVLNGNLSTNGGILSVKLPFQELRTGVWQICVSQVSYEVLRQTSGSSVNSLQSISSNFVVDLKYNENSGCNETYSSVLTFISFKLKIIYVLQIILQTSFNLILGKNS